MSTTTDELLSQVERLGPWRTGFFVAGQSIGGTYRVSEDDPKLRDFLDRCPDPDRVLELGCMEGGRTFPLSRRSGQVVAVDARREHLQRARWVAGQAVVPNVTFLELDLEAADLRILGEFDAVYNVGLLYHLDDPARLLKQLAAISPRMFLDTILAPESDSSITLLDRDGYRGALWRENPTEVVGGIRSTSFRPTRDCLLRMLDDAGWRAIEVVREDEEHDGLSLWCRTSAGVPTRRPARKHELDVAVIVTCHNYARYLEECLQSLLNQTRRPDEILVVDDASDDDTAEIAGRFADWGVRYLKVEHRDPRLARLSGLKATTAQIVSYLDADDRLTPDYVRCGLAAFADYDVGLVYSDADLFEGETSVSQQPDAVGRDQLSRANFVHAGALVRREALEVTGALEVEVDSRRVHEDWLAWRRVLADGWRAVKQRAMYAYRFHGAQRSAPKLAVKDYYALRALDLETITLFIPLSGRDALWPGLQEWLETQRWPHEQVALVLCDTSLSDAFGDRVRRWLAASDYPDVRYYRQAVGEPGLADQERRRRADVQDRCREAMCRIYNRFARQVSGDFVWIVEDDVLPPLDGAEHLLRAFDEETASVAGPYPSPYHEGYVAWTEGHKLIRRRGEGVQEVEGNGFGCVMLRGEILRKAVFTCRQPPHADFDPAFYARLSEDWIAKLCWACHCEHRCLDREAKA